MRNSSYHEDRAADLEEELEPLISRLEDVEIRKLRDLPQLEDPIAIAQGLATISRKLCHQLGHAIRDLGQIDALKKQLKQLQQAHTKETKT